MAEAIVLDTPAAIDAWRFLSRMHQIALELNTGMTNSRGPILRAMHREGLIDVELKGTAGNKRKVLALMVDKMKEFNPSYTPSLSIERALKH